MRLGLRRKHVSPPTHDDAVAALHDLERYSEKLADYDSNPNRQQTRPQPSVPLGAPLDGPPIC